MKKIIIVLLLMGIFKSTLIYNVILTPPKEVDPWEELILKIMQQESAGNHPDYQYGFGGVVGALQISCIVVDEINNTYNTSYTYADRLDSLKSIEIFNYYQSIYNPTKNDTLALRLWNAGPKGLKKENYHLTNQYIKHVQEN
jgi:hypothetical protein